VIDPLLYFLLFLKASLFSTGGFSNLPSLHQDLIGAKWATDADFGEAIAIGQISPGPNGLWTVSLGYITYGPPGAGQVSDEKTNVCEPLLTHRNG